MSNVKTLHISVRNTGSGYIVPCYTNGKVFDLGTGRRSPSAVRSPSDNARFPKALEKALREGDEERVKKLSMVWLGSPSFGAYETYAILWNSSHGNNNYDRFGTKNIWFITAIVEHGAKLL